MSLVGRSSALVFGALGCAGLAPAPDVAELRELWLGSRRQCAPVVARGHGPGGADVHGWKCQVAGWDSVTLIAASDGRSLQALTASSEEGWRRCELKRFARDTAVAGGTEGKIVSDRTVAVRSGPFAGTCLTLAHWYDRPRCDVTISAPTDGALFQSASPESLHRACARY
jgi:hypothetical protein